MSREPVRMTRPEIEAELVETMRKILGNGVTRYALTAPGAMELDDIVCGRHLYERLQVAAAALGALRGYDDKPRGFWVID